MSGYGPLLAARLESFSYDGGAPVVRDLRLALRSGSLTAVLGGSGSGTSTVAKILAGWALAGGTSAGGHVAFEGELALRVDDRLTQVVFRGAPDDPRLSLGAWGRHVALLPQRAADLLTGAAATVGEEIAFALEQRGTQPERMRARVAEAAAAVGLGGHLDRDPHGLSGGEVRRLALACAIVGEPSVLVLDDPSASLDPRGLDALHDVVAAQRAAGTAVVVVGSCVDALARRADHCILLDRGTAVAEGQPAQVLASEAFSRSAVLARHPGEPGVQRVPGLGASGHRYCPPPGPPLAALDSVTFTYPGGERRVLADCHLSVRAGEVLAVTGPNGAGKSTALRHLAGIVRPSQGRVAVLGRDIAGLPAGRVAEHVGTLFQEPRDTLFERTALREVAFGLRPQHRSRAARNAAEGMAREALTAVGLVDAQDAHPYDLPASSQRLLALAAVLARRPRVLLLDEPTVGLDRHGLERLESLVAGAARAGAGVVLSTHAIGWAREHAHRVVALVNGRFVPA